MQVFSSHTEATTAGYFTPNGKLLVTTSADSSACVFDPRENAPLLRLAPHQTYNFGRFEEGITSLAVAPASNFLAIGGANGQIRVINLPDGKVVSKIPGHAEGESIEGLAFMDILGLAGPGGDGSTKGLLLVSAATDGKAIVWDVTTSKPRAEVHHEVCRDPSCPVSLHMLTHLSFAGRCHLGLRPPRSSKVLVHHRFG
jgi:ribosome assembly protein SQT1